MTRVIRQSVRCFVFGALGAVPIIGIGLAIQTLRLQRRIFAQLEQRWHPPPLYWYWLTALLYLWAYGELFGAPGAASIFLIFGALQSYHLWRSFPSGSRWNPGERHLFWGVALAYLGCFGSISVLGVIVCYVGTTKW